MRWNCDTNKEKCSYLHVLLYLSLQINKLSLVALFCFGLYNWIVSCAFLCLLMHYAEVLHFATGNPDLFNTQVICIASTQSWCLANPFFFIPIYFSEAGGLVFYQSLVQPLNHRSLEKGKGIEALYEECILHHASIFFSFSSPLFRPCNQPSVITKS